MRTPLTDQVALVTGAAHRVGRAIALELARQGVHILVHYGQSAEAAQETVREIKSLGVDAQAVQANLAEPESITALFAALAEGFGRLHILVNSASNFQKRALTEVTLADWQETMAINLTAPFLCTQAAVPLMRRNDPPGGVIINILDKGALKAWSAYPHHSVSKAGLWMLTQVSASSLGPDIRVNAVLPGPVMKPSDSGMSDADWLALGKRGPLQRVGAAEDVARAVAYLASEDFVTGTLIHVDGGEHLW
ncbi:MAG: SDR family oxidoreductase [Anaerolineae bacterium]|nr:SDR family oxidoreductase [Anaerolineae bacterium]